MIKNTLKKSILDSIIWNQIYNKNYFGCTKIQLLNGSEKKSFFQHRILVLENQKKFCCSEIFEKVYPKNFDLLNSITFDFSVKFKIVKNSQKIANFPIFLVGKNMWKKYSMI